MINSFSFWELICQIQILKTKPQKTRIHLFFSIFSKFYKYSILSDVMAEVDYNKVGDVAEEENPKKLATLKRIYELSMLNGDEIIENA